VNLIERDSTQLTGRDSHAWRGRNTPLRIATAYTYEWVITSSSFSPHFPQVLMEVTEVMMEVTEVLLGRGDDGPRDGVITSKNLNHCGFRGDHPEWFHDPLLDSAAPANMTGSFWARAASIRATPY
jgi:hypothetical protein